MAKRFSDSELWNRDWFLNLEGRHQLFCLYLRDICDHAGVWNPAFRRFEQSTGFRVNPEEYLSACNSPESVRIMVLENGRWWITGFIEDQYKTKSMNESNGAHRGIINSLRFNNVPYLSCGYEIAPTKPLPSPYLGAKDKDKDKDNVIVLKEEKSQEKRNTFQKPTIQEVSEHCKLKGYPIDAEAFVAYYESKGWLIGRSPMKSWKAALVTWKKNGFSNNQPAAQMKPSYHQPYVPPTTYRGVDPDE